MYFTEHFSDQEIAILNKYFTNVDKPVFAIINLPEVVKGALFARYSRSDKSLRRLFLDEFLSKDSNIIDSELDKNNFDSTRAEKLYDRVFSEYGDDSVAQLGAAHVACEQSSNILTKILERGRLSSYLEQSTRYIFYDKKDSQDNYNYFIPKEIINSKSHKNYKYVINESFNDNSIILRKLYDYLLSKYPNVNNDSEFIYKSTIRAKACDGARGILPASTKSNVGIFASGQSFERMIISMNSHDLIEVRDYAKMLLEELRKVIPSFLKRVDLKDRGIVWSDYFRSNRQSMEDISNILGNNIDSVEEVDLIDWDKESENKIITSALYPYTSFSESQIKKYVKNLNLEEKRNIMEKFIGNRLNRRHIPGRGLENSFYRFDILSDYGSFRDLQRHRMLTIDWQKLTIEHGYNTPDIISEINETNRWEKSMSRCSNLFDEIKSKHGGYVSQYAVPFAFKFRYIMQMNAREAFHILELRTSRQGHPDYRRICQKMHSLIKEKAGHKLLANAMKYVDYNEYDLERLEAQRKSNKI